jgi:hypothetical protein
MGPLFLFLISFSIIRERGTLTGYLTVDQLEEGCSAPLFYRGFQLVAWICDESPFRGVSG